MHLVQPMYKHLMGWPVTLRDLEHIDDQVYRNLLELLDFDDIGSPPPSPHSYSYSLEHSI